MTLKRFLYGAGVVVACMAVVLSLVGSNIGANGMPQDANPRK